MFTFLHFTGSCMGWYFSMEGATDICIFEGNMDSVVYKNILSHFLLPFVHRKYPTGHCFMQDNDPKHTANTVLSNGTVPSKERRKR